METIMRAMRSVIGRILAQVKWFALLLLVALPLIIGFIVGSIVHLAVLWRAAFIEGFETGSRK